MKYLKKYESINSPQIGDYVIMRYGLPYVFDDYMSKEEILKFISNNIGKIIEIIDMENKLFVEIEYDDIPDDLIDYFSTDFPDHLTQNLLIFNLDDIKMFDKDKEILEIKTSAIKYNL